MPTLTPEQIEKRARWRAEQKTASDALKAHAKALRDARKAKAAAEARTAGLNTLRHILSGLDTPERGHELIFTEMSASRSRLTVRMKVRLVAVSLGGSAVMREGEIKHVFSHLHDTDITDAIRDALNWPTSQGWLDQSGMGQDPANSVTYALSVALYGEPYRLRYRWES